MDGLCYVRIENFQLSDFCCGEYQWSGDVLLLSIDDEDVIVNVR